MHYTLRPGVRVDCIRDGVRGPRTDLCLGFLELTDCSACLRLGVELPRGSPVTVNFVTTAGGRLTLTGNVVYAGRADEGGYRTALQLDLQAGNKLFGPFVEAN